MLRHAWLLRAAAVTRAAVQSRWRSSSGISGTGAKATKLPPVQLSASSLSPTLALPLSRSSNDADIDPWYSGR